MAYKSFSNNGAFRVVSKMQPGESVEGYLVGIEKNQKFANGFLIQLETEEGTAITVSTAGTVTYDIRDVVDTNNSKDLVLYAKTKIVRIGSKKSKMGKDMTVGDILQDTSVILAGKTAGSAKKAANGLLTSTTAKAPGVVDEIDFQARRAALEAELNKAAKK